MSDGRAFDFDAGYGAEYDRFIRRVVPAYEALFPAALALLDPAVGGRGRVLVVGTGSGSELVTFAAARPGWSLTGVDLSEQMLRITRGRLEQRGLADRVTLHHGPADSLPAGAAFDGATLGLVLHFLPDDGAKLVLLRAIAARLRRGAAFVLVDAAGDPESPGHRRIMAAWDVWLGETGLTAAERRDYRAQVDAGVHFVSEARLRELLLEAGFDDLLPFYRFFPFNGWVATRGAGDAGGERGPDDETAPVDLKVW